jgi:AcrR family transcriptional regulator
MNSLNKPIRIPRQKRSIKRKQKIIETALTVFSQKGFFNTSSNEIAAEAGIPIGSFYAYFKDKKQLFLAVMDYYNELILNKIKPVDMFSGEDIRQSLTELIKNLLKAHRIHPEFHQEIMAMYLADADVRELVDKQNKNEMSFSLRYLKAGRKKLGTGIKPKNLNIAAFIISNIMEKIVHETIYSNVKIPEDRLIEELVNMVLKYILCDLPTDYPDLT